MLNIVLPIAGRGSRFAAVGVTLPKPLIPIHGTPMIEWVTANVRPRRSHRFIYLCLQDHLDTTNLRAELERICPACVIVPVRQVTQGAACTALVAREFIDSDEPLMLANSDQFVDIDINDYLSVQDAAQADGLIMTFRADHPKWSYVGFDAEGRVERVVEKEVISHEATVGIYNFARGRDFVRAADRMIAADLRVNGEFYVAPTYNALIAEGARIAVHNVGSEGAGMYGLGIPEDLALFVDEYSHALSHAGFVP